MKKTFLLTLLAFVPLLAFAVDFNDIYYAIDPNTKTASVSGCDYWAGSAKIPSTITYEGVTYTVTSVAANAFYQHNYVAAVQLPSTITSIGQYAFSGCKKLTSVNIPDAVKVIEKGTFYNSENLTSVSIGANLTTIKESAFYNCRSLRSIN